MTPRGKTPFDLFNRLGRPPGTPLTKLGGDGDPFDLGSGRGWAGRSLLGGPYETLGRNLLSGLFTSPGIGGRLVDVLRGAP